MQSAVDRRRHHQQQQPQHPQTDGRQHTRLRRSHSPLYNYTALWAHDLLARGAPHTAPDSSSSTNRLNPIAVHDRMVMERRQWTRFVCACFSVCLVVNVISIVLVSVVFNPADSSLLQKFMKQEGSDDVLERISIWKNMNAYPNTGSSDHPISIHFIYRPASSQAQGKDCVVTGWQPNRNRYLTGIEYDDGTGRFQIKHTGVYQVYSQLSFTCPKNESFVEFKQELKDETDTSLLEDIERVDCRNMPSSLPGHVSFMMSALQLQQGRKLHLCTNQLQQLFELRDDPVSFFGIVHLHSTDDVRPG